MLWQHSEIVDSILHQLLATLVSVYQVIAILKWHLKSKCFSNKNDSNRFIPKYFYIEVSTAHMFHIKKWTCKQIRFPQWKWACVSLRGIWCNISSWCWTRVAGCTVGMYRALSAWIADYWPTSVAYQRGLLIHNTKMTQGLLWYRHDISLRFQETQVIRIFVSRK